VIADLLTAALAEEIARAPGLRVFVPTTPATDAAARAARELGAPRLALARGFTDLDAGQRGSVLDVFTLLRRGLLGVAVTPVQLDAAGRTNLSGIGPVGRPKTALIGPRGLPENNDTPSPLWYLLAAHSPRTLVARVDMVCGPAPTGAGPRVLLTPAGRFELGPDGWSATWLAPGGEQLIAGCPQFPIAVGTDTPVREAPSPETLATLQRVDPAGARLREFGE
jgi:hypothetical protein